MHLILGLRWCIIGYAEVFTVDKMVVFTVSENDLATGRNALEPYFIQIVHGVGV
jgi:hypothetical protein